MIRWRVKAGLGLTTWEPWLDQYIPTSTGIALDIGANSGQWANLLAGRFSHVYAFEPQPEVAVKLRKAMPSNVWVVAAAAWSSSDIVPLVQYGLTELGVTVPHDLDDTNGPERGMMFVPAIPIDSMELDGSLVSFIKVDVEGAELRVMQGARRTIERDRPTVLIENHSASNRIALEDYLGSIRYEVKIIESPFYP